VINRGEETQFFYAVYDEEMGEYGVPQEIGDIQEIEVNSESDFSDVPEMNTPLEFEVSGVTTNLKTMTPTMRKYFKTVTIGGALYL